MLCAVQPARDACRDVFLSASSSRAQHHRGLLEFLSSVHMLQASFAQEWNTLLRSTTSPWTQIFVVAELAPPSHSSSFALTQTSLRSRPRGSAALESEGNNSHHAVWNKGEQLHTKEGEKAGPLQRRRRRDKQHHTIGGGQRKQCSPVERKRVGNVQIGRSQIAFSHSEIVFFTKGGV